MTAELELELEEKLYTVEEFLELDLPELDEESDFDYELIGGRIVPRAKAGTSAEHGKLLFRLAGHLNQYLDDNPIGQGFTEASCTLGKPKGTFYVKPDLCFVANGRTPAKFRGLIPVAPDLVIEVHSPSDNLELIQDKIEAYLEAGVRLVWSIFMPQKFVAVYKHDQPEAELLGLKDQLEGGEVLAGFSMALSKLFE